MSGLYADAVLAQAKAAHGAGRLEAPQVSVTVDNPLCGDRVTIDLDVKDGRVAALGHKVRGCVLCQAAASVIGARAVGSEPASLRAVGAAAKALVETGELNGDAWPELAAFAPVHGVKSRRRCVTLPFEALDEALDGAA